MRIATSGLTVRLGGAVVVEGVDLVAEPGEVTALVGPNGSGKTTLMRAIAGLVPHGGDVRLGADGRGGRERIGYMAQDGAGRIVLTVLEVVLLGRLGRLGLRVAERDLAAAAAALDAVGLTAFAGRHLGELSGGQRQLVQFAQVLAREPEALLLDEPTSALDLRHQLELLALVRRETARRGLATLLTIHDLNAAARFADRIVVIDDGRLVASGTPDAVLVPDLIARVYGVEARIRRDGDGLTTVSPLRAVAPATAFAGPERPRHQNDRPSWQGRLR